MQNSNTVYQEARRFCNITGMSMTTISLYPDLMKGLSVCLPACLPVCLSVCLYWMEMTCTTHTFGGVWCIEADPNMHGADASAAMPIARSSYVHSACDQRCGRDLLCGHACNSSCHSGSTCPPCTQPCKAACSHGRCPRQCAEPCQPCAEPCAWHCQHQVVTLQSNNITE